MSKVLTIAKRELRSYFDSLVAYVVVGGTMLGLGIWFFLMQQGGFWQIDRASVARMFEFLPWALSAMVLPLVTMRALAEEKRTGTLELLITLPVTDTDVILGKYLAALGLVGVLLLATLLYPVALFSFPWHLGTLDWGPVLSGYLGTLLLAAAGIGVGLAFSAVSESQIVAFFFPAMTLVFLHVVGGVVEFLKGPLGDIISFVSFQTRFAPFARGLIDLRAVVYFTSVAILSLLFAFRALESRKWK